MDDPTMDSAEGIAKEAPPTTEQRLAALEAKHEALVAELQRHVALRLPE